jgi:hypothetical protein
MRKTTIFRSSSLVVLCAAVASAGATAQEPDTLQLPQRPDVHIVVAGETLWDLAQRYLDDPFLWPEIYRLNTLVVEDPHWIFPGEELRLGPLDTTMVGETVVVGQPVVGDPDVDVSPQVEQAVLPDQPVEDVLVPDMPPPGAPPPPPPTETAPTVFARKDYGAGAIAGSSPRDRTFPGARCCGPWASPR